MGKVKKGDRLVCVPCGREVVVDALGISTQTTWCCGSPMSSKKKGRAAVKKSHKKKS